MGALIENISIGGKKELKEQKYEREKIEEVVQKSFIGFSHGRFEREAFSSRVRRKKSAKETKVANRSVCEIQEGGSEIAADGIVPLQWLCREGLQRSPIDQWFEKICLPPKRIRLHFSHVKGLRLLPLSRDITCEN